MVDSFIYQKSGSGKGKEIKVVKGMALAFEGHRTKLKRQDLKKWTGIKACAG